MLSRIRSSPRRGLPREGTGCREDKANEDAKTKAFAKAKAAAEEAAKDPETGSVVMSTPHPTGNGPFERKLILQVACGSFVRGSIKFQICGLIHGKWRRTLWPTQNTALLCWKPKPTLCPLAVRYIFPQIGGHLNTSRKTVGCLLFQPSNPSKKQVPA